MAVNTISSTDAFINSPIYLEPLILQDSFDRRVFSSRRELGLENDAKGPISDNFALCVLHFSCLASDTVLDLFTYDFC